jgi:hypothetical protein
MDGLQTDRQISLAEAFGLPSPPWVDPSVTAAILAEWQAMGSPGDLWPITLFKDGETPVQFAGPAELQAATVQQKGHYDR